MTPRVLLIAEAANPEWVSVPLVGWSHARAIARLTPSHLVTQVRNRDAIQRAGLIEGREFTAIDSESLAAPVYRMSAALCGGEGKGWTTLMAFSTASYYYFEHLVWRTLGWRILRGEFDIVHRLTPLSPTVPSLLAAKCADAGVPFVLGPLNGGVAWPRWFDAARRREREWLSYVRQAYKLLPGYRSTLRNASAILVGSRDTLAGVPREFRDKCVYMPENAIEPEQFGGLPAARSAGRPLRVVFAGRLVPYKGADMVIEAAAPLIRGGALTLDIAGDGPQMSDLRGRVEREGLTGGVRLLGWVEHGRMRQALVDSHVLAFPSIREFGGGIVLEAMALGVVPIVVNYGGPAELVTPATGYLLEIGPRQRIVAQLRGVLERLAADPGLVDARSGPARERVMNEFTWDAKARQVMDVYRRVLDTGRVREAA